MPAYRLGLAEIEGLIGTLKELVSLVVIVHNDLPSEVPNDVRALLEGHERRNNGSVVSIPFPVGKAAAIRYGIKHVASLGGVDWIAQVDGHLKQHPSQLADLLSVVSQHSPSLIIADRYQLQSLEDQPHRRAVRALFSALLRAMTGSAWSDPFCGTRVYDWQLAEAVASGSAFGYGLELEQLLVAHQQGRTIVSVPVQSVRQAEATAVEKIEENLAVVLQHMVPEVSVERRLWISHLMVAVKARVSFSLSLDIFGEPWSLMATYVEHGEDDEECYAFAASIPGGDH